MSSCLTPEASFDLLCLVVFVVIPSTFCSVGFDVLTSVLCLCVSVFSVTRSLVISAKQSFSRLFWLVFDGLCANFGSLSVVFSTFFSDKTSVSVSLPLFRMASFLEAAALLLVESLELASFRSSGDGGFSSFVTDGSGFPDSPNNVFTITSLFLCPSASERS